MDPHSLDRLGDEIAELSAHLEAATARLLDLIREFDARGGWNNGFSSCAAWLSWRVGLDLGAARERVRVARALGDAAAAGPGARARRALVRQGPRPHPRRDPGNRGASSIRGRPGRDRRARRAHRARLAAYRPARRSPGKPDTGTAGPVPLSLPRGRRHAWHPRQARARGRTPLLIQALDAARETLYQRRRVDPAVVVS